MRHFASVRVVRLSPLAAVLQQQHMVTLETITTVVTRVHLCSADLCTCTTLIWQTTHPQRPRAPGSPPAAAR